jgi:NADPH:quinone reductase-like Zn-dependent oxidoreductase
MKAVRIHRFGGPEVIRLDEVPVPEPGPGEVLVRVRASSVNPVDYKIRNGGYVPEDRLPYTLGRDVAGTVERRGSGVDVFAESDPIYAMLPFDRGGHEEFVAVRAEHCAPKPHPLEFVEAAAVPLAGLTAWQGLFDHGDLRAEQKVLIQGAAGGVGHLAVQFARARGAVVYATCSAPDRDFVRALGATEVISRDERFEDRVGDVDLVFDLVGGETQARSWAVLKPGGVLVSTVQEPDGAKAAERGARGLRYMAQPNGAQLAEIGRLIDEGRVTPVVARIYPLEQAAAAERELEHGHVRGKLVLEVAGPERAP